MKKILTAALLAGGLIVATASAASAHSSHVTHVEVCTDEGDTMTVVTFDNDHELTANVAYQWGSETAAIVALAGKSGNSNPTASLPSHAVGTLKYHVTWSDNFRQPTSGDTSLTIGALTGCHDTTTTTTTSSSTSTSTSTSTTSTSTTTTTQPAIVVPVVQPPVVEQAAVPTEVLGVTLTAPAAAPAPIGGVQTGGGGTRQSGNPFLPFAVGLGGIGLIFVAMQLRRPVLS